MKVLQVTPFFPPDVGGIPDHVYNISTNLATDGIDIEILTSSRLNCKKTFDNEFRITTIPSIYPFSWPYPTLRNMGIPLDLGLRITSIIKSGHFDIVHCHGQHYPICWLAIRAASKNDIPSVLTVHTTYGLNPFKMGGQTLTEDFFNKVIFSSILKKTDAVIGLATNNIQYVQRYCSKTDGLYQISNGVNSQKFAENLHNKMIFRKELNISENKIIILFCGRFEHVKGIIEFVHAVSKINSDYSNVETLLVGDGSLKGQIMRISAGQSQIKVFGWQPQNELHKFYISADIFVIPSKYEGLPITLLEAMAASLHIVYSPVGSMPEVLESYPFKTVISNSDINGIYMALNKAIKAPLNLRMEGYLKTSISIFEWKNIAKRIKKVYLDIVERNNRFHLL